MLEYGDYLEKAIKYLGLSYGQVADAAGVTPATISAWAHNKRLPTLKGYNDITVVLIRCGCPPCLIDGMERTYLESGRGFGL